MTSEKADLEYFDRMMRLSPIEDTVEILTERAERVRHAGGVVSRAGVANVARPLGRPAILPPGWQHGQRAIPDPVPYVSGWRRVLGAAARVMKAAMRPFRDVRHE